MNEAQTSRAKRNAFLRFPLLFLLHDHVRERAAFQLPKWWWSSYYASTLLALPLPADNREREHMLAAALALVRFADDAGWPTVWPAIESDHEFGATLIASIASWNWNAQQISEEQRANLYLWMAQRYPSARPPNYQTGFIGGRTDDVSIWREGLLQQLKERGTKEACRALERIVLQAGEQDRSGMQQILLLSSTRVAKE